MGLIAKLRKAKEKILYNIKLQKNHVKVGKNISFRGVPLIYTPNGSLIIGNDTRINSGIMYNAIGGNEETSFVTKGNDSIFEKNTEINYTNCHFEGRNRIAIGAKLEGGCVTFCSFMALLYNLAKKIRHQLQTARVKSCLRIMIVFMVINLTESYFNSIYFYIPMIIMAQIATEQNCKKTSN